MSVRFVYVSLDMFHFLPDTFQWSLLDVTEASEVFLISTSGSVEFSLLFVDVSVSVAFICFWKILCFGLRVSGRQYFFKMVFICTMLDSTQHINRDDSVLVVAVRCFLFSCRIGCFKGLIFERC